jgi:antitoxin (DNA-binding transcriptional repressor) of toxin-antitoxin stability system
LEVAVAEKIRVTEAKAHLSELMARVGYGESDLL